jgi:hypothetical protein
MGSNPIKRARRNNSCQSGLRSVKGQSRPNWAFRVTSAFPPKATALRTLLEVRLVPILLQKSVETDREP